MGTIKKGSGDPKKVAKAAKEAGIKKRQVADPKNVTVKKDAPSKKPGDKRVYVESGSSSEWHEKKPKPKRPIPERYKEEHPERSDKKPVSKTKPGPHDEDYGRTHYEPKKPKGPNGGGRGVALTPKKRDPKDDKPLRYERDDSPKKPGKPGTMSR